MSPNLPFTAVEAPFCCPTSMYNTLKSKSIFMVIKQAYYSTCIFQDLYNLFIFLLNLMKYHEKVTGARNSKLNS